MALTEGSETSTNINQTPGNHPKVYILKTLLLLTNINTVSVFMRLCWSQCPRGLRLGSAVNRLLELRVRIPLRAWMSVCCECCVVSWRSLFLADHSTRGVRPSMVCPVSVNAKSRKRRPWPRIWSKRQRGKIMRLCNNYFSGVSFKQL
jgi:hypothetical protein